MITAAALLFPLFVSPNIVSFVLEFQRHYVSFLILFPSCFDSNSVPSRYHL